MMEQQAAQTQAMIEAENQARQTSLENATAMQQSDQQHMQALEQLMNQPKPPTGAI
jgi:hypothetical protein